MCGSAGSVEPHVRRYLARMGEVLTAVDAGELAACVETLWEAWRRDRTVFIVGNGGSATTASHVACDFAKQAQVPDRAPLRAHALTDSVALMTALANDIEYEQVFAEQLRIHARPGDVLICISCSGNSPSIVAAIARARAGHLRVVGFGGFDGGRMRGLCDVYVHVPSFDHGLVESAHVVFDHCITAVLAGCATAAGGGRAVFVDRDGVIVRNRRDHVKTWAEVALIPGALDALAGLSRAGHRVFVLTNQAAIGRGLASSEAVADIHSRLAREVERRGGRIEGFLVCPHRPDQGCACRKPRPGLLLRARAWWSIDLGGAFVIGDHETDMQAARSVGARGILVLSGRTRAADAAAVSCLSVVEDLRAAARVILGTDGPAGR